MCSLIHLPLSSKASLHFLIGKKKKKEKKFEAYLISLELPGSVILKVDQIAHADLMLMTWSTISWN